MQRSRAVFVLSVLAALLLAFAAPDSSEARLRVFIRGEELNPEELLPSDGVPRLRGCSDVDGPDCRAVFIVEGTFPAAPATPEFTVDGIDDKRARVVLLDGDSVDQIVLTDARITRLAEAASSSLLVRFFNEAGDLAPVPGDLDYAYAVFADGGFNRLASGRRRALNFAIGDMIEVTGRANRTVIDRSLVHVVEAPDTAAFAQDTTALLTCPGEEGSDCAPVLDTTVAITFTQVSDFLTLNGSIGVLGSNIPGAAGQPPVDAALRGRRSGANNGYQPGSVLIFPQFSQGYVVITSGGDIEPRTSFDISVTCPEGSRCSDGQRVRLRARWVCAGSQSQGDKFICPSLDFDLFTTVKGTLSFNGDSVGTISLPPGHPPIPEPPCPNTQGYLIVWVVSPDELNPRAIKFDGLIGSAVLRQGPRSASAYKAVAIQAVSSLATGDVTDVNGDGRMQFDGVTEYKAIPGQVRGTVRYETSTPPGNLKRIDTFLALMTLDTIVNRPNYPTFVDLNFYNETEVLRSTSAEFICWTLVRLSRDINRNLNQSFGLKGLVESTTAEKVAIFGIDDIAGPVTLIGLISTVEIGPLGGPVRAYTYEMFNGGRPVPTIFEAH